MTIETGITLRYWAGARAAVGVASEVIDPGEGVLHLSELVDMVLARHPAARVAQVIAVCSVLVDEQPVSSTDPALVVIAPGSTVDWLPPFAGG